MSESISPIHLLASQSAPPSHHLSDNSFAFPDALAPLVLPVDPVDIMDTAKKKITRLWPSCVPLFTFTENARLQRRKDRIIQILKLCRNKKLGNGLQIASARVLTHHQYTHTFSEETSILDCLLTSVSACTTFAKDVVYKLDEEIYQELLTSLTTRRALASSSLDTFGYSDLRPPVWAIDTAKSLTANDFEIYALQYRIRVEHFLHMLDDVHDWDEYQTRVMLDESLLAAQRNADRAHLGKQEYYLPTVPPASHSNPLKSKTSRQNSASDWSLGGVPGIITREEEQYSQKNRVPNLEALDYDTNTSINHNLAGNGIRTFRIASNTPCAPLSERNRKSLIPHRVRCRILRLRKRLQRLFHHPTFNHINRRHRLIRRRECVQRPSSFTCLQSEVSQCFTSEKSAPTLSLAHLQTAVRSPGNYITMTATETEPISHSWPSHDSASTPTTENTHRHNNIECMVYKPEESDFLPRVHAKRRLHDYDSQLMSPRDENQTHLPTKPQSTRSPSNGSWEGPSASSMSPRVIPKVTSHGDFKLSKGEGDLRTGSMRKLDDQIRDSGINIHSMVKINIVQDNATGYSDLRGKNPQLDTVSRANEPMVSITQQKEGHGDQHHQYHSYFGNNSPATAKADSLCYRCTMKLPSICASPKRHSVTPCIHNILFPEENISQETCWHQGEDLPYLLVSQLFVLRIANIRNALTSVGNWNTGNPGDETTTTNHSKESAY
ncbi:hypothetical protein ARMSODRAFT_1026739 [Armillaria solidipes]|uniref:Uncharacterized protein n=1 Tax=Armillaria solidipes TaxID=1076256 RepID=A0A2H3ARG7_9AGAR|nr:hypothetical protein ARMSODRAFT_1026739 [Armillaria solidipes]